MQAHLEMGEHNIVYEDVKRTAGRSRRPSTSSPGPPRSIELTIPTNTGLLELDPAPEFG
jgi:hypothetical protein